MIPIPLPLKGVHREINQQDLPPDALYSAENVIGRDGRIRTRPGLTTIASSTSDRPNGFLAYIDADGTSTLLLGTDDTVFWFNDSTQAWADLSASFTATSLHETVFRVFMVSDTSTVYIQNGKDAPKMWTLGDPSVSAITGTNVPISKCMMVLADRLVLGNIIGAGGGSYAGAVGPAVVTVSAALDPANGYDLTDGLVKQALETPGYIVAMRELSALQGVIYKSDCIMVMSAAEGVVPFTFEVKVANIKGPVSERSVVTARDGRQYYLAGDGNIMSFDGVESVPLGRHVQRYILDTWDVDTAYKAHGVYDDENGEIVFFYPGNGSSDPNYAVLVKLDDGSLWPQRWENLRITAATKANLPGGTTIGELVGDIGSQTFTLGAYDALGQKFLYGEAAGQVYYGNGDLDDAASIPFFLETGSNGLDSPLQFKSLKLIDHEFSLTGATQNVDVVLKKTDFGEDLVADTAQTIDIGESGPYRTYHRFPARNYALRIEGDAVEGIEWHGSTAVFHIQGRR